MKCRFLLGEKFRAGSSWQLVEWNRLDQKQKEWLLSLQEEPEIYGLFCPVKDFPLQTVKVAYREVAMIFLHLQQDDQLPHYFMADNTPGKNDIIARLVLDHIIEIKWNNRFTGGAQAIPALFEDSIYRHQREIDFNASLSMEAIRYAWLLDSADVKMLACRLYTFNTVPWDYMRRRSFLSKHPVKDFLFSQVNPYWQQQLQTSWFFSEPEKPGWYSWSRYGNKPAGTIHKLYISPLLKDMPAVFAKAAPVINASRTISFKTGNTLDGLLRPDKMVVYFESPEELSETASLLERELLSFLPQGVPFSKQTGAGGLLSSGTDPLPVDFPEKIHTGSWRTIIADELALAIVQSKAERLDWKQSVSFIRARLLSAGIDPENWSPVN